MGSSRQLFLATIVAERGPSSIMAISPRMAPASAVSILRSFNPVSTAPDIRTYIRPFWSSPSLNRASRYCYSYLAADRFVANPLRLHTFLAQWGQLDPFNSILKPWSVPYCSYVVMQDQTPAFGDLSTIVRSCNPNPRSWRYCAFAGMPRSSNSLPSMLVPISSPIHLPFTFFM